MSLINKIRILTFQSVEVLNILLNEGEYFANGELARENRNYSDDIRQLNGVQPIWCFSPVGVRHFLNPFKENDEYSAEDFINGSMFDTFRCEMSLNSGEEQIGRAHV